MTINSSMDNSEILKELGERIKANRIRQQLTQAEFAKVSGVSQGTIANAENGESIQLGNLLKILRELHCLNSLEELLPSADKSPMELIKSKTEKRRQRFRRSSDSVAETDFTWKWNDDK